MTAANTDTPERILVAAERLYAEKGLEGVSLREVGEAAGQRNTAAVHYHFGGREGLVGALFERRFASLEARRSAMLDELDATGRGDDLPSLVRVLVEPFTEGMDGSGGYLGPLRGPPPRGPSLQPVRGWPPGPSGPRHRGRPALRSEC